MQASGTLQMGEIPHRSQNKRSFCQDPIGSQPPSRLPEPGTSRKRKGSGPGQSFSTVLSVCRDQAQAKSGVRVPKLESRIWMGECRSVLLGRGCVASLHHTMDAHDDAPCRTARQHERADRARGSGSNDQMTQIEQVNVVQKANRKDSVRMP